MNECSPHFKTQQTKPKQNKPIIQISNPKRVKDLNAMVGSNYTLFYGVESTKYTWSMLQIRGYVHEHDHLHLHVGIVAIFRAPLYGEYNIQFPFTLLIN